MNERTTLLRHFLAALAYRTSKALRGAPEGFGEFRVSPGVRTPTELVRHMTSVLGYARTFFVGGRYRPPERESLRETVTDFHRMLADLSCHLESGDELREITPQQLLQGPLSDAMSHAGQLALLRRLQGRPIPPENFVRAEIDAGNVGTEQPDPVSPDEIWQDAEGREQG